MPQGCMQELKTTRIYLFFSVKENSVVCLAEGQSLKLLIALKELSACTDPPVLDVFFFNKTNLSDFLFLLVALSKV